MTAWRLVIIYFCRFFYLFAVRPYVARHKATKTGSTRTDQIERREIQVIMTSWGWCVSVFTKCQIVQNTIDYFFFNSSFKLSIKSDRKNSKALNLAHFSTIQLQRYFLWYVRKPFCVLFCSTLNPREMFWKQVQVERHRRVVARDTAE